MNAMFFALLAQNALENDATGDKDQRLVVRVDDESKLVVTLGGEPVPASQIRLENGELKILDACGGVLRVVRP